ERHLSIQRGHGIATIAATHDTGKFARRRLSGIVCTPGRAMGTDKKPVEVTEAALQQEAEASAAWARMGRELISSVDTPALLQRLCQVTTDVLQCDCSHTLMLQTERDE